jgi:hypothetical protein
VAVNVTVTPAPRATFVVVAKRVNGVLQTTSSETVQQGSSVTLEATVFDQNNVPMPSVGLTWVSLNTAAATVVNTAANSGVNSAVVTGVATGTANIEVSVNGSPTIKGIVAVTVTAPASNVARIELEPRDARITAPGSQQYLVNYFNAAGARIALESGGSVQFTSSNTAVADINATSGLATGKTAGTSTITARYLRNGGLVARDSTPLTVVASGTAGFGSVEFSIQGGVRDVRLAHGYTFQLIIRNAAGAQVTSGITPPPTASSSNPNVTVAVSEPPPGAPAGYYFSLTVAPNAVVGSTATISYSVAGASGTVTVTVVP